MALTLTTQTVFAVSGNRASKSSRSPAWPIEMKTVSKLAAVSARNNDFMALAPGDGLRVLESRKF
jgi:hypothetical protein